MARARAFVPADGREAVLQDSAAPGLGLRARANGRRTWIVHRRCNGSVVKRTPGALDGLTVEGPRHAVRAMFADAETGGAPAAIPTMRTSAPACLTDCADRRKPATRRAHADGMSRFLLSARGDGRVDAATAKDVRNGFDDLSATRAGTANRARAVLSSMMKQAKAPGPALDDAEAEWLVAVAVVRCLLDTGARKSEGLRRKRESVHGDRAVLPDATTGPGQVLHGEAVRELLAGLAETASGEWVYPASRRCGPLGKNEPYGFWIKARDAAGIVADARLHGLRHAHASHAVMNGESLHVAGRLPGHRRASTTNRHVHLDDATRGQSAARVALTVERKLRVERSVRSPLPHRGGRNDAASATTT